METKITVAQKVLTGIGTGKIALTDAIAKANAIKQAKGANQVRVWRAVFKAEGIVTKENKVYYVAAKPAATPASQPTPVAVPAPETTAVPTTTTAPTA